ncbi:glycosyltransferase family 4 protein [Bacillus sp. NP157]|nr:glycosyltransferase family 4 protein [Bacillus sp. NP157]
MADGHDVLLLTPDGPYGQRLRAMGARWHPLPMNRRSLNPVSELRLVWYIRGVLRAERPDVVHGFTVKGAVYGALAARLAGVRGRVSAITGLGYVFTSQDAMARLLRLPVRVLMRLALGGKHGRVIVQNPDDQGLLAASGLVSESSIRLIYGSGVDCTRFHAVSRQRGTRTRVLMASRLLWDKGIREYISAAASLRERGENVDFLLAGTPDTGNPASVSDAELQGWVDQGLITWLGHVDDMPALFRGVDMVVLPSYGEGLPKSLIEAAATACPIVTTDVPGCREVVTHEVEGLLVPVREAVALADAISRLHRDEVLAERLGAAAREKAINQFDHDIVIRETLKVYAEVC